VNSTTLRNGLLIGSLVLVFLVIILSSFSFTGFSTGDITDNQTEEILISEEIKLQIMDEDDLLSLQPEIAHDIYPYQKVIIFANLTDDYQNQVHYASCTLLVNGVSYPLTYQTFNFSGETIEGYALEDLYLKQKNSYSYTITCIHPSYGVFTQGGEVRINAEYYAHPTIRGEETGYFHVEDINGRYWLVTPDGKAFYGLGVDGVNFEYYNYTIFTRDYNGSENIWARNEANTLRDLHFTNINKIIAPETLKLQVPYIELLDFFGNTHYDQEYPDVWSSTFKEKVENEVNEEVVSRNDDPLLIGYSLVNEPKLYVEDRLGVWNTWMKNLINLEGDQPAKQAYITMIKERYTLEEFNTIYNNRWAIPEWKPINDFSELEGADYTFNHLYPYLYMGDTINYTTPYADDKLQDLHNYTYRITEQYLNITTSEIRKYDPNHLILGIETAGHPSGLTMKDAELYLPGLNYVDIVTVHNYKEGYIDARMLQKIHLISEKPIWITEMSYAEFNNTPLGISDCDQDQIYPGVNGQEERNTFREDYIRGVIKYPFVIGVSWYEWYDSPPRPITQERIDLGCQPSINFGIKNFQGEMYTPLADGVKEFNSDLYTLLDETLLLCQDLDRDGYKYWLCGGNDCNEFDPNVNLGEKEICDGFDNNCNEIIDENCIEE